MGATLPWFALQVRPNNEKKVEHLLRKKDYECFTPTHRSKRKWSDRTVEIDLPLFPGYVFCRFGPSALGKAVTTRGVINVVGFGGKPAEVALEEVEALRLLTQSDLLREPWKYLPDGTKVIVETGPLAGVEGIICMDDDRKRMIISVTLLQRSVAIRLDESTMISVIEDSKGQGARFNRESYLAIALLRGA
jgi:transcription antitermination factor NusG